MGRCTHSQAEGGQSELDHRGISIMGETSMENGNQFKTEKRERRERLKEPGEISSDSIPLFFNVMIRVITARQTGRQRISIPLKLSFIQILKNHTESDIQNMKLQAHCNMQYS